MECHFYSTHIFVPFGHKNIAYTRTLGEIKFLHFLFFVVEVIGEGGATSERNERIDGL
jgi:hypothetical protein